MQRQQVNLSWEDVAHLARKIVCRVDDRFDEWGDGLPVTIYGIPRGGIHAAQEMVRQALPSRFNWAICNKPEHATLIVDDIVDSGETRRKFSDLHPNTAFYALVDKNDDEDRQWAGKWVKFPWEIDEDKGPEDNVRRIIQFIGDDPTREGLIETPARVVKAYREMFSGYQHSDEDVGKMLKVFTDGSCKELVLVKGIEFTSWCEHHFLPVIGNASIAYIPNGKIVGLSKVARLLDVYSKRLQVQERLTQQITTALDTHLKPLGSACLIEARHSCMSCRGVMKQQSSMITSSLTGEFLEKPEVRAEFMSLVRG